MKKFGILTLVFALCLMLCACGTANTTPTKQPAPTQTLEPTPELTEEPVETEELAETERTEPTKDLPDVPEVDFMTFFTYVMDNYEIPSLDGTPLDSEFLANFYPELSEIETAKTEVHIAMMSSVACELAMVEVNDIMDINTVQDALQARIDAQINGGAFYPATIEAWETSSIIVTQGKYMCMYVGPEYENIVNDFISYVETGEFPVG